MVRNKTRVVQWAVADVGVVGGSVAREATVHIPDGYLSPQTCVAGYALAVPAWAVASRKVNDVVRSRQVPLLA